MLENCSTKLTELVNSSLALFQLFHGNILSDVYEPQKGLEHAESGLFCVSFVFLFATMSYYFVSAGLTQL